MSVELHFDTPFSFEKSVAVLRGLCSNLGGNDDVVDCLDRRDWHALIGLQMPRDLASLDARTVAVRRQCLAFFEKNASIPLGIDTAAVALQKFLESEEKCRLTNQRLRNRSLPFTQGGMDASLIFRVQRKIAEVLGPFPGVTAFDYGFGPGANVGLSRFTSVRRKLAARPTCTAAVLKYVDILRTLFPHWTSLDSVETVRSGRYATVPKNAKTDRSILVEPIVNSFLQKGVGSYIRSCLRRFGVDLNDQSINQRRARQGSIDGSLATLDLSSASDTISRELVAELLPLDWWLFMNDIRTEFAEFPDGTVRYLQKFSSMGNGFTFELESLIFWAVCTVVAGRDVSVYGDDLIVPTNGVEATIEALTHLGFSINIEKSFSEGPFRESCGRDYFEGVDVRPCYVKGLLSVKELFRLHNFFVRNWYPDIAALVLTYIPKRMRIYGPDGFGDGHLLGDHARDISKKMKRRGYSGYRFRTYMAKPYERNEPLSHDYAAFLYLSTHVTMQEMERIRQWQTQNHALAGKCTDEVISELSGETLDRASESLASKSVFFERSKVPRFRLCHVYTLA